MDKRLVIIGIMLLLVTLLGAQERVRYAGFCFAGNYADIPLNYPHTHALSAGEKGAPNRLEQLFYSYLHANRDFRNFSLDLEQSSQSDKALAITINRESVDAESISGQTKLIYNLSYSIYILDFREFKVLQSFPFKISYIELYSQPPTAGEVQSQIYKLMEEELLASIKSKQPQIAIRQPGSLAMKVANVEISEDAVALLGPYEDKLDSYKAILANQLTETFAFGLNVTMLPYAKDYAGQKMALAFSDARVLNFSIPPASYDLDLRLDKFHKALYKETAFERVDIYGAYINLKIYDAELETVYWDQAVKFGATKQTVNGQLTDDFANYHEVLLQTIGTELTNTIRNDKKLMENKKNKKGVIIRCANF